jgi:uncharacterized protein YjbI with pentapeptide repeats
MERTYVEDITFEQTDFTADGLPVTDYESCNFINCNFSNADLSRINFSECSFTGCDLSLANLNKTAFKDVKFNNCKLLGLHFHDCNEMLFAVDFSNCILNLSSFYKRKLKRTNFNNSSMQEVDFTEADLTSAIIDNCDLGRAIFEDTILEKADLRTAYNYSIDPDKNRIKKASFSIPGVVGLLDKFDIEID